MDSDHQLCSSTTEHDAWSFGLAVRPESCAVLPFAWESVLFSPVGFTVNLSPMEVLFFRGS